MCMSEHSSVCLQVTALGNPELLKQLSRTLAEVTRLFSRFDRDGNGYIGKEEFFEVYHDLFIDSDEDDDAKKLFERLDITQDDNVDYVSFVDQIKLQDLPMLTSKCRTHGPLKDVRAPPDNVSDMSCLLARMHSLHCNCVRLALKAY